ncbi:MAG: AAA family ATPase [Bacteroidota bacterium]
MAIYLGRAWNCRGYLHYIREKNPADSPNTAAVKIPPSPPPSRLAPQISERFTALQSATFVGRENDLNQLSQKIQSKARLVLLYGLTGIGKTALAERMVEEINGWEKVVNERLFMADFYKNETRISFRDFAGQLIDGLGIEIHDPKIGQQALRAALLHFLKKNRCFLLINSIEYLLVEHSQQSSIVFKDRQWDAFFRDICRENTFRSVIILTSQIKPDLFVDLDGRYASVYQNLLSGLPTEASLALFRKRGIVVEKNSSAERYLTRIVTVFAGHPLALETIAGEVLEDDERSVEAFWNRNEEEIITAEQSRTNASGQQNPAIAIHQLVQEHLTRRIRNTFERLKTANYQAFRILLAIARYPTLHRAMLLDLCHNRLHFSEEDTRIAINTLTRRFLLSKKAAQYHQHDLIRSMSFYYRKKLQRGPQN